MRILDWDTLDSGQRRAALARPQLQSLPEVTRVAREVIASVRQSGDEALHCLTRRFDAVELGALSVAPAEFAQARRSLARGQIAALERASFRLVIGTPVQVRGIFRATYAAARTLNAPFNEFFNADS